MEHQSTSDKAEVVIYHHQDLTFESQTCRTENAFALITRSRAQATTGKAVQYSTRTKLFRSTVVGVHQTVSGTIELNGLQSSPRQAIPHLLAESATLEPKCVMSCCCVILIGKTKESEGLRAGVTCLLRASGRHRR